jgi:hypothetical protein
MFQNIDAVERIFGDRDLVSVFAGLKRTNIVCAIDETDSRCGHRTNGERKMVFRIIENRTIPPPAGSWPAERACLKLGVAFRGREEA